MHAVLAQVLAAHRLEGAGAHVQGDAGAADPARGQGVEQGLVEMQARGGRGHRARLARVHGLVALVVGGAVGALDVRRQRHVADALQALAQRLGGVEAQARELALAAQHLDRAAVVEQQAATGLERLGGAHLRQRLVLALQPLDQDLDPAAAVLAAVQPRRQHARVVEHQQVAGIEQLQQVAEAPVLEAAVGPQHQQAAGGAILQRLLRDQFRRQLEVEVGTLHRRIVGAAAASPRPAPARRLRASPSAAPGGRPRSGCPRPACR